MNLIQKYPPDPSFHYSSHAYAHKHTQTHTSLPIQTELSTNTSIFLTLHSLFFFTPASFLISLMPSSARRPVELDVIIDCSGFVFFLMFFKWIVHWKKRKGIQESEEGKTVHGQRLLMDFYVAFLYRIKIFLGGVCLSTYNAQMVFICTVFFLWRYWLASRLHIQNVNREPTHPPPPRPTTTPAHICYTCFQRANIQKLKKKNLYWE